MLINNKLKKNSRIHKRNSMIEKNPYDSYIQFDTVMIVDPITKKKIKDCELLEGIETAESEGYNLIQIAVVENKAICIISNYSKHIYSLTKSSRQDISKKKQKNKLVVITSIVDLADMVRKLEKVVEYVVNDSFSVTLTIKHRRSRNKSTCFSDDFIHKFLQSNVNINYSVSKKSEKLVHFYIVKKK